MKKINSSNIARYLYDHGFLQRKSIEGVKIVVKPMLLSREGLISMFVESPGGDYIYIEQAMDNNQSNILVHKNMHFYEFIMLNHDFSLLKKQMPKSAYFDNRSLIAVYQYSQNSVSLDSYFKINKVIPLEFSRGLGKSLAEMHWQTVSNQIIYDYFIRKVKYEFPHFKHLLENLTADSLLTEIESTSNNFIYYYQNSGELNDKVKELISSSCKMCLTHNNLNFSDIIFNEVSETSTKESLSVKFNNWGNCSWGDPAYDVGSIVSSYLLLWLHSIVFHPSLSLDISLDLAMTTLFETQTSITCMIESYLNMSPDLLLRYPDFFIKSTQYTGLSLINQLIYKMQSFSNFDDNDFFVLKTAAKLICDPKKMLPTIFKSL